jgi:hypothetical protein
VFSMSLSVLQFRASILSYALVIPVDHDTKFHQVT